MGTALAVLCARNGCKVTIWTIEPEVEETINNLHHNNKYLPEIKLSSNILATGNLSSALKENEWVIAALPTQIIGLVCKEYVSQFSARHKILSVAKGFSIATGQTISQLIHSIIPKVKVAVLMGPLFANEIARENPSVALLASDDKVSLAAFKKILINDSFRVHESTDVLGTEVSGALKNIYAILMGILSGLEYGWNTKSAFITMALQEITLIVEHLGGKRETVYGLAGLGDLITTGFGEQSRNRRFGQALCTMKSVEKAVKSVGQVVEGVKTLEVIDRVTANYGGKLPLLGLIKKLVKGKDNPCAALEHFFKKNM